MATMFQIPLLMKELSLILATQECFSKDIKHLKNLPSNKGNSLSQSLITNCQFWSQKVFKTSFFHTGG